MSQVMLEDPASQLARLVEQASRGGEVIIPHDSTPVAKIVPLSEEKPAEKAGGGTHLAFRQCMGRWNRKSRRIRKAGREGSAAASMR